MQVEVSDRERRRLSDPQRLLWRDDVEGICPTPGACWEYGDTARCGPCAIKQAEKFGVESNHDLPNMPEVYRLRRATRTLEAQIAELHERIGQIERALMCGDDAEAMALTDLTDYSAINAALQHKEPKP
ncbi:hypothetical protein [Sphingobium sp. UBA5915]|uniref:hypothetical protein n=1 Tax=Sphingobium sp. UBA5915 TaxID=1947530 RepID=UPI0025D41484|nr:hypothetical protein [Sphingobium sp. UBA5915]